VGSVTGQQPEAQRHNQDGNPSSRVKIKNLFKKSPTDLATLLNMISLTNVAGWIEAGHVS